jgi:hypothetical protein
MTDSLPQKPLTLLILASIYRNQSTVQSTVWVTSPGLVATATYLGVPSTSDRYLIGTRAEAEATYTLACVVVSILFFRRIESD